MSKQIQAVRGMRDILPQETPYWSRLEAAVRELLGAYGYEEIRLPIVEKTELFARSIGEVTDIVEKEMYTFQDRNGDSLTLRPEGTAGCVRAAMENGLLHNQIQRLWYAGPMFRHERPQKGRYRQFHQVGVEVYGLSGPDIDAELLLMSARLWRTLGLMDQVSLEVNSLGSSEERARYRETLVGYFETHAALLDEDSQRRLTTNPLRILDSKNPEMQAMLNDAPRLWDCLGEESRSHFEGVTRILDAAGISYRINPRLVRGLDYYCNTVFEWVTDALGAQGTVCAGGRYDGLVTQLGGRETPAVGFAMGGERLIALMEQAQAEPTGHAPHAILLMFGEAAQVAGLALAEDLRDRLPGLRLLANCGGGGFKSQFKKADKSGAEVALILGEDELAKQEVAVKYLRREDAQRSVKQSELADFLREMV